MLPNMYLPEKNATCACFMSVLSYFPLAPALLKLNT